MRRLGLASVLFSLAFICSDSSLLAQESEPSLVQTVGWLNEKLSKGHEMQSIDQNENGAYTTSYASTVAKADDKCQFIVVTRSVVNVGGRSSSFQVRTDLNSAVNLSHLMPQSVQIQSARLGSREMWHLVFTTAPDAVTSRFFILQSGKEESRGEPFKTNTLLLFIFDRELAERVSHAVIHAARLCGAKNEAF